MRTLAMLSLIALTGCADRITHAPLFVVNNSPAAEAAAIERAAWERPVVWDRATLNRASFDRAVVEGAAFDDAMILTLLRRDQTRRIIRILNR